MSGDHPAQPKKKLLNDIKNVAQETLLGTVALSPHTTYIDGLPDLKVVVNRNFLPASDGSRLGDKKVAVLQGAGSGHEPGPGGLVGPGLLAAGVPGDTFASPQTDAVLAGILAVAGAKGCLVIILNYTGDRLNFGLAVEQARAQGIQVTMVVVSEDVAVDGKGAGRRGLAGAALVVKAACAAADMGEDLQGVARIAQTVADHIATVGVALEPCTLPGQPQAYRLSPKEIELGLGIHGEPGASVIPAASSSHVVAQCVQLLTKARINKYTAGTGPETPPGADGRPGVAVLVNNLGGTSVQEMMVVVNDVAKELDRQGLSVHHLMTSTFVSSLDMHGISITLFECTASPQLQTSQTTTMLQLLAHPTAAPGWPYATFTPLELGKTKATPVPVPDGVHGAGECSWCRPRQPVLEKCIRAACKALVEAESELNELDKLVGDGDCGSTMSAAGTAVLAMLDSDTPSGSTDAMCDVLQKVGQRIQRGVGGSSGALYSILFTAAAAHLASRSDPPPPFELVEAFAAGIGAVSRYGGAKPGQRTMLDTLQPVVDTLAAKYGGSGGGGGRDLGDVAQAATAGAEGTASMVAMFGRSAYVADGACQGVVDPGARAACVWICAVVQALQEG